MNQEISSSGTFGAKFMNPSFSVLLVDDNRVNQFLGKRILQNLGIQHIELAGNGEDAFYMVQQRDFDVLLTDVEMPGMDGYELSMAIRHSEKTKNKKLEGEHGDFRAEFNIKCQKDMTGSKVTFQFKPFFPNIKQIDAQVLSNSTQSASKITNDKGFLQL